MANSHATGITPRTSSGQKLKKVAITTSAGTAPMAADLVDPENGHRRIDRVAVAERVLRHRSRPRRLDDPMVGEVRLEAPVLRDPEQLTPAPPDRGRSDVVVGAPDRKREPLDHERVQLRIRRRVELRRRLRGHEDRVVGAEVEVLPLRGVRV